MSKNCKVACGLCTPKGKRDQAFTIQVSFLIFLIFSCLGGFCDVKHLFGDITGEENLDMTGTDGIFRNANGLCDAGVCYVVGVANSCEAICGKNPCPKLQDEEPCKGEFCGP